MTTPLTRNAVANILQMLAGAGLLFVLYRYINTTLGVEQLGVWSVVLATASASRLADLGLSAGITRFVARDLAREEPHRAADVIDTGAITLMLALGLILPALYPLLARLLPHLFETAYLLQALEILPYALLSLWFTIVAAVSQGGLEGCQRMDLRAGMVIAGQVILVGLAFWMVPRHGLIGLAWAQLAQGAFLVVVGRLLLRYALPKLPWLPSHWRFPVLREMLGYGLNLQAANLCMLLLDPVTKALMARFGGPAAAGYFEMANQVVLRMRALIVAANQAIVPRVAELAETEPTRLPALYHANVRALLFITLPAYTLLFSWTGIISWLLLGAVQAQFVLLLQLVILAWTLNTLNAPAYFMNMGTGRVGWNTFSHALMGATNATLGWFFGAAHGTEGVVFAYTSALIVGSLFLIISFHLHNRQDWRAWVASENIGLAALCLAVVVISSRSPMSIGAPAPAETISLLLLPPMLLLAAVWRHPLRKLASDRLNRRVKKP